MLWFTDLYVSRAIDLHEIYAIDLYGDKIVFTTKQGGTSTWYYSDEERASDNWEAIIRFLQEFRTRRKEKG